MRLGKGKTEEGQNREAGRQSREGWEKGKPAE